MKAILDADVIAYMATVGKPSGIIWDTGVSTDAVFSKGHQCRLADTIVQEWTDMAGCDTATLAFSGASKENFRHSVHPRYKHNRKDLEKPEGYGAVVEYLKDTRDFRCEYNLEGDDIMGLAVTSGEADVMVSTDKDMYTVPGKFLRIPHSRDSSPQVVTNTQLSADLYWMKQTLTGDAVDGYGGCPGVGAKGALELDGCQSLQQAWETVLRMYSKASVHKTQSRKFIHFGQPYQEAIMNARCARILRTGDYINEQQMVILWNI